MEELIHLPAIYPSIPSIVYLSIYVSRWDHSTHVCTAYLERVVDSRFSMSIHFVLIAREKECNRPIYEANQIRFQKKPFKWKSQYTLVI